MPDLSKTACISVRSWYMSIQRILELLDVSLLPPHVLQVLTHPDTFQNKIVLELMLGKGLLEFFRTENILPFYRLVAEEKLSPGVMFTYQGHLYGRGFSSRNRTPHLSLSEDVNEILPGKRLIIEFSRDGLTNCTASTRLSGSKNLFAFCTVAEITEEVVRAVPYLIGDLVNAPEAGLDLKLIDTLKVNIQDVDQFSDVDFRWTPSKEEFARMRSIPERVVKELFCRLFSEIEAAKDWGGEENDIFTSNLSISGRRYSAAFLLKGPGRKFGEMTMVECGKNGDQIYRLFNAPADVFCLQHCHKITPAVRKTMEAFALSQYTSSRRFLIIDGYDTARILHSHGIL